MSGDGLPLIFKALAFAAEKHKSQRRRNAEASPYINHPIALAEVLANEGGITDTEVLCAALLHDTIEDTETTAEELRREFGEAICALVLEVTDDPGLDWRARKQAQIDRAKNASFKAKLIGLADKICNIRDLHIDPPVAWDAERRLNYYEWSKKVVDQLRGTNAALEKIFDVSYAKRLN